MAGNTIGKFFTLTTFGESHGIAIGGVVDGCPAGLELDVDVIQSELDKRRPGQSAITTQRKELDEVKILSGIFEGKTTGTPIGFIIENKDHKSQDYSHIKDIYRPSHADFTTQEKYGQRDYRGGGRSSARETACRVVAGAIARQLLSTAGLKIWAYVSQVGSIKCNTNYRELDPKNIELNAVRCPEENVANQMIERISQVKKDGDTIGGRVTCVIEHCPVGLGEPVFDKLHADLGKAMLSINAVKGFEIGSGFSSIEMNGSEHNDIMTAANKTLTNYSGGIQGGISNGMDIYFNVAFKPVATIMKDQSGIDESGQKAVVKGKGRHDPCVVPRAVPIVEAMAAITLADHFLRNKVAKIS